jgi:hypothetical protein
MDSIEGTVILAQESRFQLIDRGGVAHHFILGHGCAAEPQQLPALTGRRARVHYQTPREILGHVAQRIDVLDV